MNNEKLRVGILGIGLYATVAHVPQLRQTGKAEVVAICRRNPARLATSQEQLGVSEAYTDWREMFNKANLDAVVICTPHDLHAEQAIAALDQGLHVFVEKPLALTRKEGQAVIDTATKAGRVVMVGYNRRFNALWRTTKETLAANAIGTLRQVSLQFALHRRWYWEEQHVPEDVLNMLKRATGWPAEYFKNVEDGTAWHGDPNASGGGMFSNSGSHLVDLILWLADAAPEQIFAMQDTLGFPADCLLGVQARLENGVLVSIASADVPAAGFGGQGVLTLIGEQGRLTHDFATPSEIWLHRNGEATQVVPTFENTTAASAFIDAIATGGPVISSGQDALPAVAFSEGLYRSAKEGEVITLN